MSTRMQQRRGTATQWLSLNEGQGPILAAGEIGFESDTNKFKIGDGVNHWVDLTYFTDAQSAIDSLSSLVDGAPDLLNTLNELAAAIGDDPAFITTVATNLSNHQSDTTDVHGISNTADLATMSYVTSAIESNNTGINQDISDHAATTANVHGIADTADIVYTVDLTAHTSATENVHGIADTSILVTTTGEETLSNKTLDNPTILVGTDPLFDTISATEIGYLDGVNSNIQTQLNAKASTEYVDTAVGNAEVDQSTLAGAGLNWTGTQFEVGTLDTPTISTSLTLDGTGDFTISADANIVLDATTEVYIGTAASGNEVATLSDVSAATADKQDKVSGVSDTEIGYLDGVTSKIQDQLDAKSPLANPTFTGTVNAADVIISGDLTVSGTTTSVSATNLEITDPLIYIGTGNTANLNDLGFVGHFDNGTYQHTGIVRDASDGKWKLFSGVSTEPTDVIDFTGATYDTLKVGTIEGSAALTGTPTAPTAAALTNTTQIATTAYVQEDNKVAYVTVSGTSLTIAQATHMFKTVHCTSSSAVTVSIPTDASDDWPVGTYVNIRQMGTGQITVAAATPATTTVVATDSQFKTRVRYSEIVLEKTSANNWIVVGDTAA